MKRQLRPGFDRLVLVAPFGVMFRDSFDRRVVADGLHVELSDTLAPRRAQRLSANPHGVFVADALPRQPRGTSPATRRFDLTMTDTLDRFLPLRLQADLPVEGLFEPACLSASPGDAQPHVPLFSAATRALAPGVGMMRADLRLASGPERAAAWARLELWLGATRLGEGLADERGSVLLPCVLPPPRDPPLHGSPPPAGFERTRWDVTLRAYWNPALAGDTAPDVCALQQQPEVPLLQRASPAAPLGPLALRAGEPLVARSDGSSFLFVGA